MSLPIDPHIEQELTVLAGFRNLSINDLLREFIVDQRRYLQEREEDEAILCAMQEGDFITQDDMFDKLNRLAAQAKVRANNH